MRTRIINVRIILPDRELMSGGLTISAGKIASVDELLPFEADNGPFVEERSVVDFAGDTVIPGLIDLHVHGSQGADTMDGTLPAFAKLSAALLRQGTVAFLATTMNASVGRLKEILSTGAKLPPSSSRRSLHIGPVSWGAKKK